MKKIILSLIALFIAIVSVNAQDVQLATLQSGDNMQAFYGPDGLKNAVQAAQQGDVISLSGGTFNSTTIDKAITLQGAGYVQDAKNNRYRTMVDGVLTINVPEGQNGLLIEGICSYSNVVVEGACVGMSFLRCLFNSDVTVNSESNSLMFLHCRIKNLSLTGISHSACIRNSAIDVLSGSNNVSESVLVENSVIRNCNDNVKTFTFKNNVMYHGEYYNNNTYALSSSVNNSYYNNLYNSRHRAIPASCVQEGNYSYEKNYSSDFLNAIFGNGNNFLNSSYDLTEEGKKFKGIDDTEVGIHGGSLPFTDVPSTPQITQKSIAAQSDANGKLSVKIVVEAQK